MSAITSINASKARQFWLKKQQCVSEKNYDDKLLSRQSTFQLSQSNENSLNETPNWTNIYSTIRERKKNRGRSISAASQSSGVSSQSGSESLTISPSDRDIQIPSRFTNRTMAEEGVADSVKNEMKNVSKRYESTCYFRTQTIPVWYRTTIELKINSTSKRYTENVYYKRKLIPERFVESMITDLTPESELFTSTLEIPVTSSEDGSHFISLIPQQEYASKMEKTSFHSIMVNGNENDEML